MIPATEAGRPALLGEEFRAVRQQTERLCRPLSPEDMMVQSTAEASPAKWHLAHTAWFFETFLLREFLAGYRPYNPDFRWLFNSYYNAVSGPPEKKLRASFSRPGVETVLDYRRHVDEGIGLLLATGPSPEAARRIVLGLNHEQQHQELLLTDIKHALWTNPLHPSYSESSPRASSDAAPVEGAAPGWMDYRGGVLDVGFAGDGFAFDNESPRHPEYLQSFRLASRPVSCAEYLGFIEDDGYRRPELWLAVGWETAQAEGWRAPLYWTKREQDWRVYTLIGEIPLRDLLHSPVCHVSYFEADAFANWAGKRLPSESEWEIAARDLPVRGNFLESGRLHPRACDPPAADGPAQMFGDVWEWTRSPYVGYPGFRAQRGALGEYNGKFMCNQMVLRGGSAATPASHMRATYRNFFSPATRGQFSGIRLASGD